MRPPELRLFASAPRGGRTGFVRFGLLLAVLLLAPAALAQEETGGTGERPEASTEETATPADESTAGRAGTEVEPADDGAVEDLDEEGLAPEEAVPSGRPVDAPTAGIEEIKIRAEAFAGTARDAPISVVGFDMDTLTKEGINDIRDLSNFTPSLEIKSTFAASNAAIFIRGVGLDDFNANAASAVAIYQDGVYMQSPAGQLFQFFDAEGVEVLRGPQGALYRSASAGAILVRSQKPTDEFQAYAETSYGNYNSIDVTSAVSGPLVPDLLSGRLAGAWSVRDGITKNRCATDPLPTACRNVTGADELGLWTNDVDNWAGRAQLLLRPPTTDAEWLFNVHGGQNFSKAFQYQHRGVKFEAINPDDPDINFPILPIDPPRPDAQNYRDQDGDSFAGDYDFEGGEFLDLFGVNLKGNWRLGDTYELEILTAYEWHDRFTRENTDASPNPVLHTDYGDAAWQLSQDFKLRGEWAPSALGDGSWSMGLYYIQEDLDVDNYYDTNVDAGVDLHQVYDQKMRNFAAYGQSEYNFQPGCEGISCDFKLTTGVRYSVEYKKFDIFVCAPTVGVPNPRSLDPSICATSLNGVESDMWSGVSGEVTLAWMFRDENNLYLKYSRGWKGGHFNGGAVAPFDVITSVRPETVDSYEFGLRSIWLDDRLTLNLTGFYYDYQDLQVFQQAPTPGGFLINKLENAENATIYGVELDGKAQPLPDMTISLNAAWVESEYNKFVVFLPFIVREQRVGAGARPPPIIFQRPFDYSGNPLIASPRFSATGTIDYKIPLPGDLWGRGLGSLTPRFSFTWKDDVFFDAGSGTGAFLNFPEATFGQQAFWTFNTALSWQSDDEKIEVTGWVHNMLDEHYKTQSDDYSRVYRFLLDVYGDPRTYGITVNLSF